jgi:hypothetical protein
MIHSTQRLALAGIATLGLAASVPAWDEYGPVARGRGEIDLGASYDIAPDAGGFAPFLQIKYGIGEGLDVEFSEALATDPELGFRKPSIALKYNDAISGFGGFVAMDLPLASEKIDPNPHAYFIFAAQYLRTFGRIVLNDWLYYGNSFRTRDDGKLDLYLKPQYMVSEVFGPYLGVEYATSGKFDGSTFIFKPGFTLAFQPGLLLEANLPVTKPEDGDVSTSIFAALRGSF